MLVAVFFAALRMLCSVGVAANLQNVVSIPGGKFTPLYGFGELVRQEQQVDPFSMDRLPVTRTEFRRFVSSYSRWSKEKIDPLFADENYLKDFRMTGVLGHYPVTYVSWFAAQAFCEARKGRLPSVLEWEFVAAASQTKANATQDPEFVDDILKWYSKPSNKRGLRPVGGGVPNFYGVQDLHGLNWEWTSDFNSVFVTGDNRQDGDKSSAAVCGAGASKASNRSDYAAFMRYAMRSSVEARFAQPNLGFRCAYDKH